MVRFDRKQQNSLKQLSFNKKINKFCKIYKAKNPQKFVAVLQYQSPSHEIKSHSLEDLWLRTFSQASVLVSCILLAVGNVKVWNGFNCSFWKEWLRGCLEREFVMWWGSSCFGTWYSVINKLQIARRSGSEHRLLSTVPYPGRCIASRWYGRTGGGIYTSI